jgi:toxin HigB-1
VIQSFRDKGSIDIFNGKNTKAARQSCPTPLWKVAFRKMDLLDSAISLNDLKVPPGNRLEALSKGREGQYSIRINDQYRICFIWTVQGPAEVEIVEYHR